MFEVPLTEGERIKYLIDNLTGGSQKEFCRIAKLNYTAINKVINEPASNLSSKVHLSPLYILRICQAFPQVNAQFLYDGTSYPGDLTPGQVRNTYEIKLKEKDNQIAALLDELALQRRVIDNLLQKQPNM